MNFNDYQTQGFYDEFFTAENLPRELALPLINYINQLSPRDLKRRQKAAELMLLELGITFGVYGNKKGAEKIFPFDLIPRIISGQQWQKVEAGLKQRIHALNLFIDDIYHEQKILKNRVIPKDMILMADSYRRVCQGLTPPKNIWIHITGTDLIRDETGQIYVLEDNLRCPSGISYVLANRSILKRTFSTAFKNMHVRSVSNYCDHLYRTLEHLADTQTDKPNIVVLTPGVYNSAYYEHAYLAQQMGVPLVEGRDLSVIDNQVMMHTTSGLKKVDVIYRRIDDDFLDPNVFRQDSLLGVPGLMSSWQHQQVALANAPGTGIADDKAIYAYVPQIIKYYLDEDPILPNVPTYICEDKKQLDYVLDHLDTLVVKAVNLSGGYGMLIGSQASKAERDAFRDKIKSDPRNYIAQPTIALSRAPTIIDNKIKGRHIDLRPYILYGKDIYVLPGGLTRVALTENSLVVNSSQGGGSKDTWVLDEKKNHVE